MLCLSLCCYRLYAAPESELTWVPSLSCPLPPLLYLFGQKLHAWLAGSFELLGSELEWAGKCLTAYLPVYFWDLSWSWFGSAPQPIYLCGWEAPDRQPTYLCISGGSRLILALDSITSFATRPLSSGKIKTNSKKGSNEDQAPRSQVRGLSQEIASGPSIPQGFSLCGKLSHWGRVLAHHSGLTKLFFARVSGTLSPPPPFLRRDLIM